MVSRCAFALPVLVSFVALAQCLTPPERALALRTHNNYRQKLAQGQIANKGGKKLPKARNMYLMRYDLAAERLAQQAANTCSGGSHGAKLNFMMGGNVPASTMITSAVSAWTGTLQQYGVGADLRFRANNRGLYYWAELAYALNYKVGCATKYCPSKGFTWIVCQYQPKEIPFNAAVYTAGAPCRTNAQCTTYKRSKCHVPTGLCVAP